ncbi:hypothetical protein P3T76_012142 [Phytophthora citrophthora]|uniref:Calcineurin-like phosphoesterase domain-containing protein n=1 Tax=Phytophthora citrophthora TaxID=4793 RepID=A0AAD9LDE0_9STRA|nr:hypothetical protein P3T76_012142 [Phytophthora citrophthora]
MGYSWAYYVMRMANAATAASVLRVALLTDVEGNWQYVRNVVHQSSCLELATAEHEETLELRDDCMLVFGGDAGDKGDQTLQCYEQLVRLKKRHPDRVVLLVGNRDVNKMRFTSELHDSEMDLDSMATEILEGPVWVPTDKRVTLKKFLADLHGEDGDVATEEMNTKVNRLKWMLEHTMGAQGDFERRRAELKLRKAVGDQADVTDKDVVKSYTDSVKEGGVLYEYLLHGSLAFVAHQTLFVHGGIINSDQDASFSALGRVPDEPSKRFDSVLGWVEELNAWYRRQVQGWIEHPTWNEDRSSRGGNELLKYVLPDYTGSVVMGRHLLPSGMPTSVPLEIASLLSESGIRRVVIGHTPHGNCPTVVKQLQQQDTCATARKDNIVSFEEVIMCDTSYSDARAPDNRGIAASELVVQPDGRVFVSGVLEDGRRIQYDPDKDPWVGRWLQDGTMVKAQLVNDDKDKEEGLYLVFRVENGYSYTYESRTVAELLEIGLKK